MGPFLLGQIPLFVEEFARGGGGGSGGSGGSGGGGVFYLVGLIGYLPMHFIGSKLRKHLLGKPLWKFIQIGMWIGVIILGFILVVVFAALQTAIGELYVALPIAVGALIGTGSGLYGWFAKVKQSQKTKDALVAASQKDGAWNEEALVAYATKVFYRYQKDWSDFNTESMKGYLSQNYFNHSTLMLYALNGAHRLNKVNNPAIKTALITAAFDSDDNSKDMFTVGFTAAANDQLYDTRTNKLLFQDNNTFTEFWHFIRSGNGWLFNGITQATENQTKVRPDIQNFAAQNGLYYSADWGWLLLPVDGYLFKGGKFGTSDINNHMIGFVNNVLTQGYTYQPNQTSDGYNPDNYLIMQTNVPKTYGRILVRRKAKLLNLPVGGLTHIKMEWGEFNDMYDVYASDLERVTSFELLNPAFMAVLRDLPFEVSIEVVDNVVYIYTKARTEISHYAALYDVLLKAHKEMKL